MRLPPGTVARQPEWERLASFATNDAANATLGVLWGRRRIGKSYLLTSLCEQAGGFYYEALRGSRAEALGDLGRALADHVGAPAPLHLPDWTVAVDALMRLAVDRSVPVVLDEYPYLREHSPELDSVLQRAFGPRSELRTTTRCRLIVCGSAVSIMRGLLAGTAPLHGRAGLDMRLSPFDYREALDLHATSDLRLAVKLYAIIGGVAAYARDMVEDDLPTRLSDLDAWVVRRVLSPAAPLFREVDLLLSEDPATSTARKPNLYHATLAGVALGNHAYSRLTRHVGVSGPSLAPILNGLVDSELITRLDDPIKENRPQYQPADPLVRFHYALVRPHSARLGRSGADTLAIWRSLRDGFASQVVGPAFEAMARTWAQHHAEAATLGGDAAHVGATVVDVDGVPQQLDVVVAADDGDVPSRRTITAIGEAKSGERLTSRHLHRLERCRAALGRRAGDAKLLLFGSELATDVVDAAASRSDVELIDLDRLYGGA